MSDRDEQFNRIVDGRRLTAVFQPVVELATGRPVGFEALIRGPRGSEFESPVALFEQAYRCGRTAELDWVCRAVAFRTAMDAGLPREFSLFVNAEPASFRADCPPDVAQTILSGRRELRIVLELTERDLTDDPAAVLETVRVARAAGLGIAIDDMGAYPTSLSMMPLIRPEVIKLDLSVIQKGPSLDVARTVNGVLAEIERTGATVLAEGIETERHASNAQAMGAVLGQGYRYGRPAPLPTEWPAAGDYTVAIQRTGSTPATPFEVVAGMRRPRQAPRDLLQWLSRHIEYRAADPAESAVLVACFDDTDRLTPRLQRRYASIAAESVMVAVFGAEMPPEPAKGVRGQRLAGDDPLAHEWVVVVVGAHFGVALVARRSRSPETASAEDRQDDPLVPYDFAVTYERDLVIAAAHSLVQRMSPMSAET